MLLFVLDLYCQLFQRITTTYIFCFLSQCDILKSREHINIFLFNPSLPNIYFYSFPENIRKHSDIFKRNQTETFRRNGYKKTKSSVLRPMLIESLLKHDKRQVSTIDVRRY